MNDLNAHIKDLERKLREKGINPKRKKGLDKKQKQEDSIQKRLNLKLGRVITKAGISWLSGSSLMEVADNINGHPLPFDTACWTYNQHTKKERIIFSPRILKELDVHTLILVLRHEMLHKAMYRGMTEVGNKELLNFALDAAINKILWLSNPKQAHKLGDWIVPENSKSRSGIHAILNPAVRTKDFAAMEYDIKIIVEDIWFVHDYVTDDKTGLTVDAGLSCHDYYTQHSTFGNTSIPDPITLYNKMSSLLSRSNKSKVKKIYTFVNEEGKDRNPDCPRGGVKNLRAVDKSTLEIESDFARAIYENAQKEGHKQYNKYGKRGKGYSDYTDLSALFEKYVYTHKDAATDSINDFVRKWETLRQIEGVCHSIHNTFRRNTSIDPYPNELTRTGMELVALDVSGSDLPYFFNNSSEGQGSKKKVCCYFDTSPSMDEFIPFMLSVIEYIDSCEEAEIAGGNFNGHYAFSEKVKGIPDSEWENFKEGKVQCGGGTSFEAVVTHAIERVENDQVDIILVFTDGFSYIDDKTVERFNESGKKCYTIYFNKGSYNYSHSRHSYSGVKGITEEGMTSDLDKLDGQSFTISCEGV